MLGDRHILMVKVHKSYCHEIISSKSHWKKIILTIEILGNVIYGLFTLILDIN